MSLLATIDSGLVPRLEAALAARGAPFRLVSAFSVPTYGASIAHRHAHTELVLHLSGTGSYIHQEVETRFGPGDAVVHRAGVEHGQRTGRGGTELCLLIDLAEASDLVPPIIVIPSPLPGNLADELADLSAAGSEGDFPLVAHLRATAILLRLLGHRPEPADPARRLAEDARRFLEERLHTKVRLADAAEALGVSEDHLRHIFTRQIGMKPVAWLTRARVAKARSLLGHTHLGLDAIARICGFASARYLCTVFRQVTGATPGEARAQTPQVP